MSNSCWEELQNGPLIEITQRLPNIEDFLGLHLVCTRWNSVLSASRCKFLDCHHVPYGTPQVPWLMMVEQQAVQIDERRQPTTLSLRSCSNKRKALRLFFYSLSFRRVDGLVITLPSQLLLDNFNKCCLHSSRGWLLVTSKGVGSCTMSLYNPFGSSSHNFIPLPGFDTYAGPHRFALSASPCTNSYSVMIIRFDNKLAFWRPGDEDWTILQGFFRELWGLLDVTFYRGEYCVSNYFGEICRICSLEDREHIPEEFRWEEIGYLLPGSNYDYFWRAYFVVVDSFLKKGEEKLLVVVREGVYPEHQPHTYVDVDYLTASFRVMEIVMSSMQETVVVEEVKNLGNKSLFVGRNQAYAIEVPQEGVNCSDFEASCYYGCKPNRIYFTDDRWSHLFTTECGRGTDMGVYNMADGSIERDFQGLSLDSFSPMLWVEPRC